MVTSALGWCVDIFKTQSPIREKLVSKVTKPNYFPQQARVGAGGSGGNTDGLPVFVVLVHQHLDAVGVSW